jgi:hypothetical protein
VVIVADSEFPATKRASSKLRERLEQHAVPVIYTRFSGAVTIKCGKAGWELSAMDGTRFASATSNLQAPSSMPLGNAKPQTADEER